MTNTPTIIRPELYKLRPLHAGDLQCITDHLLSLAPYDRYLRFCGTISDIAIMRLIQKHVGNGRHAFIGYFDQADLAGLAHLALPKEPSDLAEAAVSVGSAWRRLGIGSLLMKETIAVAQQRGCGGLLMSTLVENTAMVCMAKRFGFRFQLTQQYAEGTLEFESVRLANTAGAAAL